MMSAGFILDFFVERRAAAEALLLCQSDSLPCFH